MYIYVLRLKITEKKRYVPNFCRSREGAMSSNGTDDEVARSVDGSRGHHLSTADVLQIRHLGFWRMNWMHTYSPLMFVQFLAQLSFKSKTRNRKTGKFSHFLCVAALSLLLVLLPGSEAFHTRTQHSKVYTHASHANPILAKSHRNEFSTGECNSFRMYGWEISGSDLVSEKYDEIKNCNEAELLKRQASIVRLEAEKMEMMLILKKIKDLETKMSSMKSISSDEFKRYKAQIESWTRKISE